jgi:tetratricopeptide (TPR) repeat protein
LRPRDLFISVDPRATASPLRGSSRLRRSDLAVSRTLRTFLATCATVALLAAGQPALAADGPASAEAQPAADPQREMLVTGRDLMTVGQPRRAIDEYFDKVIRHFEQAYKDSEQAVYSSQSLQMGLVYSAIPRPDKKGSLVLDSTWGDAYLLKAYALTDLGELQPAREALQSALVVSPMSAKYMSELAYTYTAEKNFGKSIELYRRAADFANLTSSGVMLNEDLARAWRVEAFALIEQGKTQQARALYEKCLELDPHDSKALDELKYLDAVEKR